MKRLRAAAAWTSGGYRVGMCTTTLLSITKTEPASRLHVEVITECLVFLRDHRWSRESSDPGSCCYDVLRKHP